MRRFLDVDLETKINGILLGFISLIILSLSAFYLYHSSTEYVDNAERITLQSSKTISFLPGISSKNNLIDTESIGVHMNQYVYDNDIDFIVIQDTTGKYVYHPDVSKIDEHGPINHAMRARIFGAYYVEESTFDERDAFIAYAPIYSGTDVREIVGMVQVGYYKSKIYSEIYETLVQLLLIIIVFILVSVFISRWFANYIKSETLGYEPKEITTILRNRENIFSALNEGIISTNIDGKIEYSNKAAKKFLNISRMETDRTIQSYLHDRVIDEIKNKTLKTDVQYFETSYGEKEFIVIVNRLFEKAELKGFVFIFRDMTEKVELTNKLQIVESLFDDLRAQSHEYKNKLHLISGLLEMKKYQHIRDVLTVEMQGIDNYHRNLLDIDEDKIKALILAKMNSASEKRVVLTVQEGSHMFRVKSQRFLNALLTIISNLLDNAIDEVASLPVKEVIFYIGYYDDWLEIMVQDSGNRVIDTEKIFEKGYSTKSEGINRGYGLYNVKTSVDVINGFIDVLSTDEKTIFTVEIPIYRKSESN